MNLPPFDSKKFTKDSGASLIRIRDINSVETEARFSGEIPDGFWVRRGEIVIGMDGDFNAARWKGEPALLNQRVAKISPNESFLDRRFCFYALGGYLQAINANTPSVTVKHLSSKTIGDIPLPLPPLPEQKRIADKLDALLARVDAIRARLDTIPALLKRFRQSVLAAATSGALTEEWRGGGDGCISHPDVYEEHGIWKSDELPSSWRWVSFALAFDDNTNSRKKLPQSAYDENGTLAVIDQGESLIGGYTNRMELRSDAPSPAIVFGDHTRCVKYIDFPFAQGADGVKVLNPTSVFSTQFAYHALCAIELPDKGYSRHSKFLRASYFPAPPIDEQHEIIRRVESLFAIADRVQAQYTTARARVDKLTPALLAKAFRGELVPQDPSDEPASALLERLRAGKPGKRQR